MSLFHIPFIKDLLQFLPSKAESKWGEVREHLFQQPFVILVSGFLANRRTLSIIRKRLLKDRFNVIVLSMDWDTLSDSLHGLNRMAEKLSSIVQKLRQAPQLQDTPIHLIAHSAGGLVARYYIQLLGGSHHCDSLVTLATPHRGTWIALLGIISHLVLKLRILLQMLPISKFIHRLNTANWPTGFRMLCIHSQDDKLCSDKSAHLLESIDGVHYVELTSVSHHHLLLDKRAYKILLRFIQDTDEFRQRTKERA